MQVTSLASGSQGNAYLVQTADAALLIDCGLSWRTLSSRLCAAGFGKDLAFAGVLLTHSHLDHVKGLSAFLKRHPDVPVFANAMTAECVVHEQKLAAESFMCFENGQGFEVGGFSVSPFSVPHDAPDPVGYLVAADDSAAGRTTYFHGTDIGTPLTSVGLKLAQADIATLESNHDSELLYRSGRPVSVIQRISGPRGHLSNDQSAELVRKYASPRLRKLALAHLSGACNAPHLAERTMRAALDEIGRGDIVLDIFEQDKTMTL